MAFPADVTLETLMQKDIVSGVLLTGTDIVMPPDPHEVPPCEFQDEKSTKQSWAA
jgi:hypothetical protein